MDEVSYDNTFKPSNSPKYNKSLPKPQLFAMTQSMNQYENANANNSHIEYPDGSKAFRPTRITGTEQNAKRLPIFPALQRFQKPQPVQQQQQRPKPMPFFGLLKPSPELHQRNFQPQPKHHAELSPKHELSSDKDFPFSSPPKSQSSSNSHTYENQQQPRQMLPPPPPPTAPISRPGSRAGSRPRCLTPSQPNEGSIKCGSPSDMLESKSMDLPDIAINAIRQVQVATTELAEERRRCQSLLSQLNALSSTHEALQSSHTILQKDYASTKNQLDVKKLELKRIQDALASSQDSLTTAKDEISVVHNQLSSVTLRLESTTAELGQSKKEAICLKEERRLNQGEFNTKILLAKKGLASLGDNYASLQATFQGLKLSYDTSQRLLEEMRQVKGWAADGLQKLEPLLESGGKYSRASEVGTLISELQDEIAGSHRVNDLLRDKLHHVSSQFAEARERVRELEEGEKTGLGDMMRVLKGIMEEGGQRNDTAGKLESLAGRLVKREEEGIEAFVEAAELKSELEAANKRITELELDLAEKEKDIGELKGIGEAKRELEERLEGIATKLMNAEETLLEDRAHLISARERVCSSEKQLLVQQERNEASEVLKNELKASLCEALDANKKVEGALKAESTKQALTQARLDQLEAELAQVKKEKESRGNELRQADSRLSVLQDRFDAQTITLRLAKENCGDLQERLVMSEGSFATKLAAATSRFEIEIAVLKERNIAVQATLDDLRKESATQQGAFLGASVDFEKKMAKQEAASDRLFKSEQGRGDALEREATEARRDTATLKAVVEELREKIVQLEEEGRESRVDSERVETEEVRILKVMVEELEKTNDALVAKARKLKERYSNGHLTDDEKDFVDWLNKLFQSLHEQEVVAKENELRRRENMIFTLQGQIRDLESGLAHVLKEKENEASGENKSMVDLTAWLSLGSDRLADPPVTSNPSDLQLPSSVDSPGTSSVPILQSPAPLPTASAVVIKPSMSLAPHTVSKANHKTKATKAAAKSKKHPSGSPANQPAHNIFSRLNALDSESDTPLSDPPETPSTLGKRERVVSSMKVEKPRAARRVRAGARPASLIQIGEMEQQQVTDVQEKAVDVIVKPRKKRKQ